MDRQPWCVGSGQQVGVAHNIGGRVTACPSCGRSDLQINRDGTLRYHVAYLMVETRSGVGSRARPRQPSPIFA